MEKEFIGFDKVSREKIVYGAIKGMVESLEDPYTAFFDPDKSEMFLDDVSGKFEGVGMMIGMREEQLRIISPISGTPAERSGVRPGDVILAVDGFPTKNISVEEAVAMIRGPKGTSVVIDIARNEDKKSVTIIRDVINIPSISWEVLEEGIAHIKLHYFHEGMMAEFSEVANSILNGSVEGIIVDLRNNPGGSLSIVRNVSGWFLQRNSVVVVSYEKGLKKEYKSSGNPVLINYPTVVLINEGSASASEIMAAALRDNRDIKLIGKNSFGKGSIQSLNRLSEGTLLKVTVSEWFTPNGEAINGVGLIPDIEVEQDFENTEEDIQLNTALEVLKREIIN